LSGAGLTCGGSVFRAAVLNLGESVGHWYTRCPLSAISTGNAESHIFNSILSFLGARVVQSVLKLGYGLDDRGSIPVRGNDGIFPLCHRVLRGSPSLLSNGYRGFFPRGVTLTIHQHPVPRLRMSGVLPPLPQYFFMVWCLIKQWIRLHGMLLG
jgi:hypothetical protein